MGTILAFFLKKNYFQCFCVVNQQNAKELTSALIPYKNRQLHGNNK